MFGPPLRLVECRVRRRAACVGPQRSSTPLGAVVRMPASRRLVYEFPCFLEGVVTEDEYRRWLQRKAQAHARRDRSRGNLSARIAEYKRAIHEAVVNGGDRDAYTGEPLSWERISTYDNVQSKAHRRQYKKSFANLPTVDHVGDGSGPPKFRICSWRVNDSKHDLSLDEFVELCRKVVAYQNHGI